MITNIIKVEDHCPKTKNPWFPLVLAYFYFSFIIDNHLFKIQTELILAINIFYLSIIK
jgi:hypothetical protein